MVCFTSVTRHARLGLACAAVLGLLALTAPAVVQATLITIPTETWTGSNHAPWPGQWEFVNPGNPLDVLTTEIFNGNGLIKSIETANPNVPATVHALIDSSLGLFSDSVQDVMVKLVAAPLTNLSLLARYSNDPILGESYYAATFGRLVAVGDFWLTLTKTVNGATTDLAATPIYQPSGGAWTSVKFTTQDVSGGVDLNFQFTNNHTNVTYPNLVTTLPYTDGSHPGDSLILDGGRVGLSTTLGMKAGVTATFDNYNLTGTPWTVPASAPVPEPASLTLLGLGGLLMFAGNRRRRVGLNG